MNHLTIKSCWTKFQISFPVPEGSKVYFAFSDPDGSYGKIFDGYRHIHEVPLHVATLRKINLFPDWWAVSQTNYVEAPNCWGRTKNEVLENLPPLEDKIRGCLSRGF